MVLPFLFKTSTLTINRHSGTGYWNESGEWVESPTTSFDTECNIQPFREGKNKNILPEGKTTNDAIVVYSKTELQTSDQFTDTLADWFVYKGREYEVFNVEDWSSSGLLAAHYKHIAIRRDQNTNGGL